jgi:hypothetical protein
MIFARYHTSFPRNGLLVHTDRSVPPKDGERIPKRGVIIILYLHRRNLSAFLCKIVRSSVILLLPLLTDNRMEILSRTDIAELFCHRAKIYLIIQAILKQHDVDNQISI